MTNRNDFDDYGNLRSWQPPKPSVRASGLKQMKDLTGFTGLIPAPIKLHEIGEPRRVVVDDGTGEILRVSLLDGSGKTEVARAYFTPVYYWKNDETT